MKTILQLKRAFLPVLFTLLLSVGVTNALAHSFSVGDLNYSNDGNSSLMSVMNPQRLGSRSDELTVHDGGATNGYVPVYGFYTDAYLKAEFVMPAEELSTMANGDITAMKFYASQSSVSWGNASFQVFMTEIDSTSISAFYGLGTIVYDGALSISGGEMDVTFTTPYHYNGGNLLIGFYNIVKGSYVTSTWFGETVDGASVQGYSYSSLDTISPSQRNFLPKTTFTYDMTGTANLVVTPNPVAMGYRPNGAWMRPMEVNLFNLGSETTINSISVNNPFFQIETVNVELPYSLDYNQNINLNLSTNGTSSGIVNANLIVNYGENEEAQFDVTASAYAPVSPDVWELAPTVSSFPYTATLNTNSIPLYDNYRIPPTNIVDGADAVYKLVFTEDTYLNASVTNGENGKVALYPEDFQGVGGPDLGNSYTRPQIGGSNAPFEAQIGDGTNTTGYLPMYYLYNYSLSQQLYTAAELAEAGATTAPMTSISWFSNSTYGYNIQNISIWMANVNDVAVNASSPLGSTMNLVYEGNFQEVVGWNEFVFNAGSFAWDGSSNVLVMVQMNNGSWSSSIQWQSHNPGFQASAYVYQDGTPYSAQTMSYSMTTSSTTRPNIIMMGGGHNRDEFTCNFEGGMQGWTTIDNDGDGHTWFHSSNSLTESGYGYEGLGHGASDGFMVSASYSDLMTNPINADNYLVSPQKYFLETGANLSFFFDYGSELYPDHFEVCVATADNPGANDFTSVWNVDMRSGAAKTTVRHSNNRYMNWRNVIVDLSAYVGQDVWIAFHHQDYDEYEVWIDDVTINACGGFGNDGIIADMTVTPGTYYLVASSTSDEFTVEINTDEVPCPELATNPTPADATTEVGNAVNLTWNLDSRATEYRLMFGTTYYCEETLVDWTDTLSERYRVYGLNNNTNYFWRIDQRNDGCPEGVIGQVWGFTTHLNIPINLYADNFIHLGDDLTLSWDDPNDRSFLYYNVYQDGELIGSTYDTYYTISNLPYNINPGYYFNVTAVYNEGESNFSNTRWVRVTGEGTVEGYVYEQDGVTPIQGARVEFQGTGEIGGSYWYYYYTDENGHYSFNMMAGTYSGTATHSGYQNAQHGSFTITYNELTSNINFVMDELFNPVSEVVAEYYPDAENPESSYVKVYWGIDDLSNWLYYDDGVNVDAIGLTAGGSFYWGVMFPAGTFAGSSLKKVSMYDYSEHTGNIMVYQGGTTAPGSLLYTQPYTCTGSRDFVEWTLNTPVVINPLLPLWIVMNNDGGQYIASCCTNTGDANSRWISLDGATWEDLADYGLNYTWMIRAYVTNGAKGECVAPVGLVTDVAPTKVPDRMRSEMPNDYGLFSISGSTTTHNVGVPSENVENTRAFSHYRVYRTDAYNNGPFNLDNTVLIADEVIDTLLIDVTWPNVEMGVYKWGVGCVYVGNRGEEIETPIHWTEPMAVTNEKGNRDLTVDFESGLPTGWNVIDGNNDGLTWTLTSAIPSTWTYYASLSLDWYHGGSNAICSGSYINGYGAITPDEYLVSPQVNLGVGSSISFWVAATDVSYPADHFGVFVSDDGTSGWTSVQEWTLSAEKSGLVGGRASRDGNGFRLGTWYNYTVDLSAYDGLKYVAFRHFDCYDQYIMCLDDISIVEGSGLQEPRESGIVWSNWISKDMILGEGEVNITVTLNSEDSPAGTTIGFVNLNSAEQQHYPMANITLDNTGYYAWDSFRKGDYQLTITKDGYETIIDNVSIWDATSLSYVMTEIIYSITDLYVSRTGWVKWDGHGEPLIPGSGGSDDSFEFGFENDFEGWTTIDNDGDSLNWVNSVNSVSASGYDYTGLAHGGDYFVYSQSYIDYDGAYNADNYLVSPQKYSIVNGSTLSFWADNANDSYPDHFAIAIATVDNPGASDFVDVWSHSGAKSEGKAATRYAGDRYQNWRLHSVDLSAYAGQEVWIAFHHQDYDMYEIWIDDVTLTAGAKNGGDRLLEYYQVMCENLNHEPIFNINTPHNFCQVVTDQLVEGEHYLCQVVAVYSTGMSVWSEIVEWEYEPCDHWGSVDNVVVYSNEQGNHIEWIFENGYNPYGGNKSSLEFDSQPSNVMGDDADYPMLSKGGEFYSQYAEDGLMLNFFALDNVDLRAYLLYNLSNDIRFSLVPEEEYGQFILTSNDANNNFMDEFETAYQNAMVDFSLMSKVEIDDHLVTWKSSVAPINYLSIMMDVIIAKTRNENDHCINSIPFCTSDVVTFNAASTSQTADQLEGTTIQDGCIGSSYNPSWYHMRIHTAGQFVIHMEGHDPVDPTILRDIDYCVWGPFTNPYLPCTSDLTTDKIIDCNYSAHYSEDVFMGYYESEHQHQTGHGTVNYHMPEIGEYYIMMITNYSRQPCNITFTKTEGVGETDCDIINTTGIIGFLITEDDEFVTIASPDDRDYTVEGEFGEHEYCVRPIYPGEMHLPAQNYGWSMGCPQTASNDEEYHWNVDIHQYPYNMSVTGIIQINGVEQQTPTLEIGAFCGDECRGTQRLTYFPQVDRYLVFFTLYGDAGDVMSFRLYDHTLGEELDLSCSSTISFVPDGFIGTAFDPYVFNFGNTTMVEQVSTFSEGYNWWSTYIEQEGVDGLGMLQEGLGDNGVSIRSQASGYTDYYAGYGWYGSLSSINNESSYRVITNAPCTVTMSGDAAVPSQHPITLGQGWTWIGYVPSTAMSVDAAMANVNAVAGDKVKSQQGYADYYEGYGWYGSLNTIEPGMGLMYYSTNGNPVSFTYPDSGRSGELKQNLTAEHNHWVPNVYAYPDNMTVMAVVELNDEELGNENYELAAFAANGECRGSVKLTYAEPLHRHVAFLTISGKDAAELSFRLYDTEKGVEYYDAEESLDFNANAIVGDASDLYVVHFRGTTDMDEFANKVKVYPNPVASGNRFSIGMNTDIKSPVRVEIVDALGAVVSVETSTQAPASVVAPITAGVYTLRITVEGKGTAVRKLVVK